MDAAPLAVAFGCQFEQSLQAREFLFAAEE
jgi:hypothetical protein